MYWTYTYIRRCPNCTHPDRYISLIIITDPADGSAIWKAYRGPVDIINNKERCKLSDYATHQLTRDMYIICWVQNTICHIWLPYTTYSRYKHFTLIDEKTSIPLSVRGAYIAITAPYLHIWCLQYYRLFSGDSGTATLLTPLESSSQIICRIESPPRLSSWHRHHL